VYDNQRDWEEEQAVRNAAEPEAREEQEWEESLISPNME
jgi:hypothetical protein